MSLSKRTRFEVFKRDSFTCQYCGAKAPDVLLHVDHIVARANGGTDDLLNLTTACVGCNLGKSAVPLSDSSAVTKQRDQMAALQERQEQVEMMLQWHKTLTNIDSGTVDKVAEHWCEMAVWYGVNEDGKKDLKRWIKKYVVDEVLTAMRVAADAYFRVDPTAAGSEIESDPTTESANQAFNKIGGICEIRRKEKDKPWLKDAFYVRGILRNRERSGALSYVDERLALTYIENALVAGADAEVLKDMAKDARTWSRWRDEICEYIDHLRKQG